MTALGATFGLCGWDLAGGFGALGSAVGWIFFDAGVTKYEVRSMGYRVAMHRIIEDEKDLESFTEPYSVSGAHTELRMSE